MGILTIQKKVRSFKSDIFQRLLHEISFYLTKIEEGDNQRILNQVCQTVMIFFQILQAQKLLPRTMPLTSFEQTKKYHWISISKQGTMF